MRMPSLSCVTVALLFAAATPAAAQVDSALAGERVRVWVSDVHRQASFVPAVLELRGTVTSVSVDSLTLLLPGTQTTISIPTRVITGLAISRGVPSRAESGARGAAWGALHGAMWGAAYAHLVDRGHRRERTFVIGASAGAIGGLLMGAVSPHERWRTVRIR